MPNWSGKQTGPARQKQRSLYFHSENHFSNPKMILFDFLRNLFDFRTHCLVLCNLCIGNPRIWVEIHGRKYEFSTEISWLRAYSFFFSVELHLTFAIFSLQNLLLLILHNKYFWKICLQLIPYCIDGKRLKSFSKSMCHGMRKNVWIGWGLTDHLFRFLIVISTREFYWFSRF